MQLVTVKLLYGSVRILRRHHIDEAEATRVAAVRVADDGSILNLAVLGEEVAKLIVPERAREACDEQVCAGVPLLDGAATAVLRRGAMLS